MVGVSESDKCVFICGAGFSTQNGPPVMARFMDRARRNYFGGRKDGSLDKGLVGYYERMLDFHSECLASAWAFRRDWDNVEELYTQADLIRLAGFNPRKYGEKLCRAIEWAIWHVYRHTVGNPPQLKEVRRQLKTAGLTLVFITTNYDTLIERSFSDSWNPDYYYPGFRLAKRTGYPFILEHGEEATEQEETKTPIIKLHGSANWFKIGDSARDWIATTAIEADEKSRTDDRFLNRQPFDYSRFLEHILEMARRMKPKARSVTPALIPPMLGKVSASPVIAAQWRKAIEELERARQIWVVGYSFPITDPLMKRLLTQGVQGNRDLEAFVIADIQTRQDWQSRLDDLFPPTMLSTKVRYVRISARYLMTALDHPVDTWLDEVASHSAAYIDSVRSHHTF